MTLERRSRIPQFGEVLILTDGRRFTISAAQRGARGGFQATALDYVIKPFDPEALGELLSRRAR